MKSKSFLMILMLLILPFVGLAQSPYGDDVVEIVVEKGGQLQSKFKKANALQAKKVFINGKDGEKVELNEKDLKFLLGMNQLEELYLNVTTEGAIGFHYNGFSGNSRQEDLKITNSRFPNLKLIGIGKNAGSGFYKLFDLKVNGMVVEKFSGMFQDGIIYENLYLLSEPDSYGHDGYEGFLEYQRRCIEADIDNSEEARLRIHSIHTGSLDWLNSALSRILNPAVIYVHNGSDSKKYLANYQSLLYDEDKDLTKYDGILPMALSNCSFDTLKLPDAQEALGESFFYNVTANVLDLNKVKTIGNDAFCKSHIKELHIPATVQDISGSAFDESEISTVYMEGEYAPSIGSAYNYRDIQFIIPKGTRSNYDLGEWKKLKVLEDGATTNYTFDVKEPGTLVSLLTDEIIQNVTSLKLRGILYSDDIKLLEKCLNLKYLDISETFIAQSPKELKEKQEESEYLAQMFVNMGVIAQSEYEHYRMSTTDNLQVQLLAKLGEMAKNQKITSDPNCQLPQLGDTHVEELILPLQLQRVVAGHNMIPKTLKKMTLPPDLKEFSIYPHIDLTEIVLPSSVKSIKLLGSNIDYDNLQLIDMSACENPSIEIEGDYNKPLTIKFPETYTTLKVTIGGYNPVNAYFKGRELSGYFYCTKSQESTIYIPRGSRAGYSKPIQDGCKVVEQ